MTEDRSAQSLVTEAADWADITLTKLGKTHPARPSATSTRDLLARALPQMAPAPVDTPPVDTPPDDGGQPADPLYENWANWLSGAVGLVGRIKWKPGSTGCDLFVPRGTIIRAPFAGHATFQQLPDMVGPHGELTLVRADGLTVRIRHELAAGDGGDVAWDQAIGIVYDPSLDLLTWPAGLPTPPDGYQHADLSLASDPSRLDPSGGAGGDINAFAYLQQQGVLDGWTIVARTPGPQG